MVDHGGTTNVAAQPRICPFLRAQVNGTLAAPVLWPAEANRCVALADVAPQSFRQQEYACLASAHVHCPRFRRGLALAEAEGPTGESGMRLTPAVVAALVVLAASFALSVGFVVANGGMTLRGVETAAESSPSDAPSASAAVEGHAATPSIAPGVAPSPSPTPAPTPAPSPEASPTAAPSATASPQPSSDRYELLTPCGDEPDCWMYEVRSGDNLTSIANYFGVPLAEVYERNPWAETEQLRPGLELRLPPPTR
jgi:hypothetical protein